MDDIGTDLQEDIVCVQKKGLFVSFWFIIKEIDFHH